MLTAVIRIKTTMDNVVQECLGLFGEGARTTPGRVEEHFALGNTTEQEGYFRVVVAQHIALALEYVTAQGFISEHAEFIKVEWTGQENFILPSGGLLGVIV